jgi:hypothetical protein
LSFWLIAPNPVAAKALHPMLPWNFLFKMPITLSLSSLLLHGNARDYKGNKNRILLPENPNPFPSRCTTQMEREKKNSNQKEHHRVTYNKTKQNRVHKEHHKVVGTKERNSLQIL